MSLRIVTATTNRRTFAVAAPESEALLSFRRDLFVNRLFAPQTGQTVVRVGGHQGSDSVSISHPPLKPLPDPIPLKIQSPISNIDEIAAVDGADVLFVGPTDLSYNMGIRDQLERAQFTETLKKVSDAAKRHGKAAGIFVHNNAIVPKARELGYSFTALGSDGGAVRAGLLGFVATLEGK